MIPPIKDDRDEIYYAWRKSWAYGLPSKEGEKEFNAHGKGFQEGWRAAEQWIKDKNT
jgi:hypothetical protein